MKVWRLFDPTLSHRTRKDGAPRVFWDRVGSFPPSESQGLASLYNRYLIDKDRDDIETPVLLLPQVRFCPSKVKALHQGIFKEEPADGPGSIFWHHTLDRGREREVQRAGGQFSAERTWD